MILLRRAAWARLLLLCLYSACGPIHGIEGAPAVSDAGSDAAVEVANEGGGPTEKDQVDAGCDGDACAPSQAKGEQGCPSGLDEQACAQVRALLLPSALPAAKGNAVADNHDAAVLGFHVFFDIRFSQDQRVRCETCHSVDYGFADNHAVPVGGIGEGVRNAPTAFNAPRYSSFLWDGRADSLWSQPLMALENPKEMNFSRLEVTHAVVELYRVEYERVFGPLPDFSDAQRFPAAGKPGVPAFDAMTPADQLEVNRVFSNVGKAIEAYLRKLATGPSRVDVDLASRFGVDLGATPSRARAGAADGGLAGSLSPTEARGLVVFANAGCLSCHSGPNLSDDAFHDLGVPSLPQHALDEGRSEAVLAEFRDSPFRASGPFFDGDDKPSAPAPALPGGFRTPSLRNLGRSQPYGHNGVFARLEDVVDFHLSGGGSDSASYFGTVDEKLKKVDLSADDRAALIAFLKALDGDYPALPWGQWPSGNG
jgi:cytochrome c peroxidase